MVMRKDDERLTMEVYKKWTKRGTMVDKTLNRNTGGRAPIPTPQLVVFIVLHLLKVWLKDVKRAGL